MILKSSLGTKKDFIQVNGSIYDYSKYIKNVVIIKNFIKNRLKELMIEEDFLIQQDTNKDYSLSLLKFYNPKNDMEVHLLIKKRHKEMFV